MPGRYFISNGHHWGLRDGPAYAEAVKGVLNAVHGPNGTFLADAMLVWGRSLGFLDDEDFVEAWKRHAKKPFEAGIVWRTAVLVWALRTALRREGGVIECGCFAGTTARILMDVLDLSEREVFLYDLFEHTDGMTHHKMPEMLSDLYEQTAARFPEPNVRVIKGSVPDSFAQGVPEKVAFAHIDMNNAPAELAALDALEHRFVPGAVIVFDDYGQLPFRDQHVAEKAWFARRDLPVLEIPTGQGIVIW